MKHAYKTQNIFISSTFLDMQVERDLLNKKVLPVIREYALKYRINIELVDLRFGIDIGNENELDKIVNVCESEIERCKPLFIGLIGDRYGTIFKDDLSITGLEMLYSIKHKYNTLFYSRNINNRELLNEDIKNIYYQNEEKVKLFKEKLDVNIKEYNAFYDKTKKELTLDEDFTSMLINDIKCVIDNEYSSTNLNNYLSPYINHSSFLSSSYVSIFPTLEEELIKLDDINEKLIVLFAPAGYGKSMILSKVISAYIESKKTIITYSPQTNSNKGQLLELLNSYNQELSDILNIKFDKNININEALDTFYKLLSLTKEDVIFICDSYELIYSDDQIDKVSWIKLDNIPNSIKLILSTNSNHDVEAFKYVSKVLTLNQLDYENIATYLTSYLNKKSKKVSDTFFTSIVEKINDLQETSLMYLSTAIEFLFYNDRKDAEVIANISKTNLLDDSVLKFYLDKLENMPKSLDQLLNLLTDKKLELANKELVNVVLTCLSNNESGIKEEDLNKICLDLELPYINSDFAYIRYVLKDMISQSFDGTYVLAHDYYKNAFKTKYNNPLIIDALCNRLLSLDNQIDYKHPSICRMLYLINRKQDILQLIKSSIHQYYMSYYTKDIIDILNQEIEFINDIEKVLNETDFAMYVINYLLPGLDINKHSFIIQKLKDKEEKAYYYIAVVASEINKTEISSDLLVESSEKIDCYIKTNSLNNKLLLAELYINISEYLIEVNEPFGACRYLSLTNALLKDEEVESRSVAVWGKLANVYLMLSKIFFNTNMFNFIREYYYEALDIASNHTLPMLEIERFIRTSLHLLSGIHHYQLDLKVEVDEDLLELATKYKNDSKTFSSIYLYLLVKMKYYELTGTLHIKMKDLLTEIQAIYEKTNNIKIKQLELMLNFKVTIISKLTKEKRMKLMETFLNAMLVNIKKYEFDIYEIEEVLFCYINLKNASINEGIPIANQYITPFVNSLLTKYNREEILFRFIKREVFYQDSFDSNNKVELLSKVVPLSIKIYLSNPTLTNVNNLMSDIYYYCDSLEFNSLDEQQRTLKKGLDCLNHFNTMYGEENNFTFYKTYFYISRNAILSKDMNLANSYLYKMIELVNSLCHDSKNSNMIMPLLGELYYFNTLDFDNSNEKKEFANRIYDLLNSLNSNYLKQLQYPRYEDVPITLTTTVDIKSDPIDIIVFYDDKTAIIPILDFNDSIYHPAFDFSEILPDNLGEYDFQEYSFNQALFDNYVDATDEEKIKVANKMIENKDYRGYQLLGLIYENKDLQLAMKYYTEGTKYSNSYCYLALGTIYYYNKYYNESFNYLYQGALLGNYLCIKYVVEKFRKKLDDIEDSYELLMEACEKNMMRDFTHPICQETLKLATRILDLGDLDPEDYIWYVRFYRMTNTKKSYDGARTHMVGFDHINKDKYFFYNARYGAMISKNPKMMSFLSYAYLLGIGVEVDYNKAYNWCIEAIENGDLSMGLSIVDCIYSGYGIYEINYEEADQILFLMYEKDPSSINAEAILTYIGEENLKPKFVKELKNKLEENK